MIATLSEERVDAPRPMKFPPLDPNKPVTNKQLADQNQRLHDCLHNVGERVDKLAAQVEAGEDRDRAMGLDIATIKGALGISKTTPETVSKKLAGVNPGKALLAVMAAMGGVQVTYQIFIPWLIDTIASLHRHFMGG